MYRCTGITLERKNLVKSINTIYFIFSASKNFGTMRNVNTIFSIDLCWKK